LLFRDQDEGRFIAAELIGTPICTELMPGEQDTTKRTPGQTVRATALAMVDGHAHQGSFFAIPLLLRGQDKSSFTAAELARGKTDAPAILGAPKCSRTDGRLTTPMQLLCNSIAIPGNLVVRGPNRVQRRRGSSRLPSPAHPLPASGAERAREAAIVQRKCA
jgi:hypothetical protein